MTNQRPNTTRLQWRCRKALVLLAALAIASVMALFSPASGQVQSMVKNQPFPFPTGVAMDSALYASVRAKLVAAESLRISSQKAIQDLQGEIKATRTAKDNLFRLQQYDAHRADSLTTCMQTLQGKLQSAQDSLTTAQGAIDTVLGELPRRIRKALVSASPDQVATNVVTYVHTLQARKWKWLGAGTGIGTILTLIALATH